MLREKNLLKIIEKKSKEKKYDLNLKGLLENFPDVAS